MKYDDATHDEKKELNNIVTLVNTESHERNIDSALADLIDLAADKGMRGKELNKLINKMILDWSQILPFHFR